MEISINTPALLFPAISLLLLAYTNRFLAIASLVRKLYDDYKLPENRKSLLPQLLSLRRRLNYIRQMQGFGVFSFLLCVACMYSIYNGWTAVANFIFALSFDLSSINLASLLRTSSSTPPVSPALIILIKRVSNISG
jgi:hypothetical protein